ncbi:aminopeptidase N [Hoeflea prorocentri]|uniref:Aminopeptidase N n=1 Tax=Hoeflea prorocentri TaxID=1922333 RepID=A0A9X3ZHM2_9HYPH|nr:aminopeptidase N [Hoeflea prorocentri]MCY6381494.1 aminopeptidase N [Hoeflea prorocentri]MDA5399294.1 aminopeptidase N [Hoeflea prorocentri]
MKTDTGQDVRLEDYRPTDFEIETVDLTFRLDPAQTRVTSRIALRRRSGTKADVPLVLDGDELNLVALKINDVAADNECFAATPSSLEIRDLPETEVFTLEIVTEIAPAENTKLMGLYRSNGVYCTQCEAEGFRRITYFLDRPDVLAVFTTCIEAPTNDAPLLLSNGNPGETGELGDGWHFAVWHDPHPKPSYLFALVAGDLAVVRDWFVTRSGKPVVLEIYVEHGKQIRANYAMDALKRAMSWDEERFGREYDLSVFMIVAVSDFNMGAMENKGLNIFNDKYVLADSDTATDADYANIEAIIAHEYFHNWTGNRITCRDWFQLCLKEGLTVYRDHEFSADMRSRPVKRIAEVRLLKAHQFPEDSGPLAHPVRPEHYSEINNFYTATVYEKGSEVVRMLATILGPTEFKAGLDLYFSRHDGDAATIEDFLKCFEDANQVKLTQFALWYRQAGTPVLTVSARFDGRARKLMLDIEQSAPATPGQPKKRPMHIPLRFGLIDADGAEIKTSDIEGIDVTGDVMHVKRRAHKIVISKVRKRPVISLNRSFSAPINIHFEQGTEDLFHLARFETDAYSRWQALNELALRGLIAATGAVRDDTDIVPDEALVSGIIASLEDGTLEPAMRAQAVLLPGEADIARELGNNIDPDAIFEARNGVLDIVAMTGADAFDKVADGFTPSGRYTPDAESAGKRALYLAALDYLSRISLPADALLPIFRSADNMTIMAGVLAILAHRFPETAAAETALAEFELRFRENPLVIDKWLQIQATIPGQATLARVKQLMGSNHFSIENPNRVRALIGSFSAGNPTGFNRADGAAFAFLAGLIIELDARNPQVAARILTSMRSWKSLEPVRQEKARTALVAISEQPSLSPDVRDITDRTLGQ